MRHFFVLCLWGAATLGASAQAHDLSNCSPATAQHCQASTTVAVVQLADACAAGGCKVVSDSPVREMSATAMPEGSPAPSWADYGKFLLGGVLAIGLVSLLGRRLY
ncbi:hypothetical protein GCM10027082_44410 [Comamonas humi]